MMLNVRYYQKTTRNLLGTEECDEQDRHELLQAVIDGNELSVHGRRYIVRGVVAPINQPTMDLFVEDLGPVSSGDYC